MYGKVKQQSGMQAIQNIVNQTVEETLQRMTAPQVKERIVPGDGLAHMAYCYNILPKKVAK